MAACWLSSRTMAFAALAFVALARSPACSKVRKRRLTVRWSDFRSVMASTGPPLGNGISADNVYRSCAEPKQENSLVTLPAWTAAPRPPEVLGLLTSAVSVGALLGVVQGKAPHLLDRSRPARAMDAEAVSG